jgi:hypothetical protein
VLRSNFSNGFDFWAQRDVKSYPQDHLSYARFGIFVNVSIRGSQSGELDVVYDLVSTAPSHERLVG